MNDRDINSHLELDYIKSQIWAPFCEWYPARLFTLVMDTLTADIQDTVPWLCDLEKIQY